MPAPWAAHAQVRIKGRIHNQQTVNVLNFATNTQVLDDFTGLELLKQLANDVSECVQSALLPAVSNEWRFAGCDATKMSPTKGDAVDSEAAQDTIGERGPTSVSFAASLIRVSTGGGGRSGRGRIFLPPPGEADITQSAIDGPTQALLLAFCTCLIGKFINNATTPWRLGVLSRKKVNNALPPIDQRFREAISLTPANNMARIGSRQVGHGN